MFHDFRNKINWRAKLEGPIIPSNAFSFSSSRFNFSSSCCKSWDGNRLTASPLQPLTTRYQHQTDHNRASIVILYWELFLPDCPIFRKKLELNFGLVLSQPHWWRWNLVEEMFWCGVALVATKFLIKKRMERIYQKCQFIDEFFVLTFRSVMS